jgi:hypothetical protein
MANAPLDCRALVARRGEPSIRRSQLGHSAKRRFVDNTLKTFSATSEAIRKGKIANSASRLINDAVDQWHRRAERHDLVLGSGQHANAVDEQRAVGRRARGTTSFPTSRAGAVGPSGERPT